MSKIRINTHCKRLLADVYTPVAIYLRLRDRFRDTVLLESTDHHLAENSWSFIGVNAIAGMEITTPSSMEFKLPGQPAEKVTIKGDSSIPAKMWEFMKKFQFEDSPEKEAAFAQGLYGYSSYDAVQFFETIELKPRDPSIPLMRYRLYQYVIAFNHFKDELFICENKVNGVESELALLESFIRNRDVPTYPFQTKTGEYSNMEDEEYRKIVKQGIAGCHRGDVFQVVLSRRFQRKFTGDEFNVYRALRSVNPSPYLFYFDYGDYRLFGSSPEAHLVIAEEMAVVHPIAGTFKRSGNEELDRTETKRLLEDAKENAEHVMLVDLARNDLSRFCEDVKVASFKKIQYYSHVIHLVSEVKGKVRKDQNPFELVAATFPAGTLSGAPKFRAMEMIDNLEPTARGFYGGAIGFVGFDGTCNMAIMIRTFLVRDNTLTYQAGAGIVAASDPEMELQEVNNKMGALRKAIELATVAN